MSIVSLWRIIVAEWKIKFLLGGVITVLFWAAYFRLEQLSHSSVTQMPALAIDRMVPFMPSTAFVYVSQFVTVPLVVWLMTSRRQLLRCCHGLLLLMSVSFLVFYFWPTVISRPGIVPGKFFIYDMVVGADKSGNACPSLHAAFGIFTAGCAWEVFQVWRNGSMPRRNSLAEPNLLVGTFPGVALFDWMPMLVISSPLTRHFVLSLEIRRIRARPAKTHL